MRAAWLVGLVVTACANSTSVVCSDGTICPGGFQCDVEHQRCLLPEQVAACDGRAELADCTFNGVPGVCRDGACEVLFCGDGEITGREACDGAELGGADCITAGFYAPDGLACSQACTFDTSGCGGGYCGDSIVNGPELCDGPTSQTCVSIGFDAGSVSCNAQCGFQIRDCSRFGWNPESLSDVVALAVGGTGPFDQWAVGLSGRAMRYEGVYWTSVPTPVANPLIGVWAITKDDAWAIGASEINPVRAPVVIRWDGLAWAVVAGVPAGEYTDVWAADASNVYLATEATGILRFDGATWSSVGTFTEHAIAIRGTSPTDIWVATRTGPLWHFDGAGWSQAGPVGVSVEAIDANAPDDVWVIGLLTANFGTAVVAHYDGAQWRQWQSPRNTFNDIASSAPNDAWVGGLDGIMRHWDGVTWSHSTNIGASPTGLTALSGLVSLGPAEVVGVSTLNLAYRYRGAAFGVYPPIGPNPFDAIQNLAMWGPAGDDQYVTNVRGEVLHYDGAAWSVVFTVPGNRPAPALHGSGPDDVWIGTDDGTAYHFDGISWTPEAAATVAIQKIWVSASGDVWVFTGAGAHHLEQGTWVPYALGGGAVRSVSGTSPADVWAIERGSPDKLWHWDGSAWTEIATGASFPLLAVVALAPDDVHVSAMAGRMLHYNGSAWTEVIVPSLADLEHLAASARDDVVAASERDLFHYNGSEWSAMRPPVDFVPNTADYIPIAGIQVVPNRIDVLLQRYRIRTLIRTRALACRSRELGACSDAVDNDCDGALDREDSECP